MKKNAYILALLILAVSLSGCVTVQKVVKERVDQEIEGNEGFIKKAETGGKKAPAKRPVKMREYIDVKVELPSFDELSQRLSLPAPAPAKIEKEKTEDKAISGNKGFIGKSAKINWPTSSLSVYNPGGRP